MRVRPPLLFAIATVLLALAVAPAARAESSPNVRLLSNTPLPSAIALAFAGDTMFATTAAGVFSYDVSDPAAPRLLGALPMYIWENEDMDLDVKRQRLFISRDPRGFTSPAAPGSAFPYGAVHIIDISDPASMKQVGFFLLEAGHTSTCINDCDVLWTGGPGANPVTQPGDYVGRPIYATDVTDPANPKPCPEPIDTGRNDGVTDYAHDVQVDAQGVAWVSGAGGVRGYWTRGTHRDPLSGATREATGCAPIPFAGSGSPEAATSSRFMHNAWRDYRAPTTSTLRERVCRTVVKKVRGKRGKNGRRGKARRVKRRVCRTVARTVTHTDPSNDVLLATEENIVSDCATSGRFVAYDLRGTYDGQGFKDAAATKHRMKALDTWTPEGQTGASGCASSHYFASRGDGITANAFYEQGVRILDTTDPTDLRQVGFFREADSNTWATYWHKGRLFVADFGRGIDVLEVGATAGRAQTLRAPVRAAARRKLEFAPTTFGGLCPLRLPGGGS